MIAAREKEFSPRFLDCLRSSSSLSFPLSPCRSPQRQLKLVGCWPPPMRCWLSMPAESRNWNLKVEDFELVVFLCDFGGDFGTKKVEGVAITLEFSPEISRFMGRVPAELEVLAARH